MPTKQPADIITAEPRQVAPRTVWLTAVVLLAAALTAAVIAAVHYHGDAQALRSRLRSAAAPGRPRAQTAAMSTSTVLLPKSIGLPTGEVTAFSVHNAPGLAQVVVTAQITGARPNSVYELIGGDCAGGLFDHVWAAGITNSNGVGQLTGRAWTVSVSHEYYLVLGPMPGNQAAPGPAVRGFLATAHGLTAARGRIAPCAP